MIFHFRRICCIVFSAILITCSVFIPASYGTKSNAQILSGSRRLFHAMVTALILTRTSGNYFSQNSSMDSPAAPSTKAIRTGNGGLLAMTRSFGSMVTGNPALRTASTQAST